MRRSSAIRAREAAIVDHSRELMMDHSRELPASYLIHLSSRLMSARTSEALRADNVSPAYLPILMTLSSEGPKIQSELAAYVAIEPPTMTRTLRRMERDGLVTRSAESADGRRTTVRLTARAELLLPRLVAIARVINREATAALPAELAEQYIDLMARVAESLRDRDRFARAVDHEVEHSDSPPHKRP